MHGGGILCLARTEYGIAWFAPVFEDLQSLGFEGTIETLTLDAAREIEPSLGDDARFVVRTSVDRYVRPESLHGRARGEAARAAASSCASTSTSPACAATARAGRSRRTAEPSRPRRSS